MPNLTIRPFASAALLGALVAPGLSAAEAAVAGHADGSHFLDVRVGVASTPAPEISEEVTSAGTSAGYEWMGSSESGWQLAIGSRCMRLCGYGGWIGGIDLVAAEADITPGSVRRSDGTVFVLGQDLAYRSAGLQLAAGYAVASSLNPEELAIQFELTPFIGGGGAWAQTAGVGPSGSLVRDSGWGYYYEYGVRAGLYFTERHFLAGINAFWLMGSGSVDVELGNTGAQSELTLDRDGFGGGFDVGWRF